MQLKTVIKTVLSFFSIIGLSPSVFAQACELPYQNLKSWPWGTYTLEHIETVQQGLEIKNHNFPLRVVLLEVPGLNSKWTLENVKERLLKARQIFHQCDIAISCISFYRFQLKDLEAFQKTLNEDSVLNGISSKKISRLFPKDNVQTMFFTTNFWSVGYSGVRGFMKDQDHWDKSWINDKVFEIHKNNTSGYMTEAHELGHNLTNDPVHFDPHDPSPNLMSEEDTRGNLLNSEQCEAMRSHPSFR